MGGVGEVHQGQQVHEELSALSSKEACPFECTAARAFLWRRMADDAPLLDSVHGEKHSARLEVACVAYSVLLY